MELTEARKRMDEVDAQITHLFESRMELSAQIALIKRQSGQPTLDERRENEKLSSVSSMVSPAMKPYVERLYKELFTLSRDYQNELRHSDK